MVPASGATTRPTASAPLPCAGQEGHAGRGKPPALAFEMFELGAGLRQVVMALHLTPEQVRSLYHDFKTSLYSDGGTQGQS
jgi:hypothetical protein